MADTKFTPGPWEVSPIDPHLFPSVRLGPDLPYSDGSGVGEHYLTINEGQPPQVKHWSNQMETCIANARLIAAAPELYETLAWLHRKGGLGLDVHERIEAVLSKVTK
jgi:hypothetical protein